MLNESTDLSTCPIAVITQLNGQKSLMNRVISSLALVFTRSLWLLCRNRCCRLSLGLLVVLMAVSGCQPKSSKTQTERDLRQEEKMMAMISIARSYHQRASIAQKMGKNDDALREIDMILAMSFTKGFRPGEELLLDAWARKATMLLEMEQPKMALDTIQQAITRPTWLGNSFYIAHLFHVKGRILEALQQPEQALAAYQRSIELNKAVIQEILQSQNQGSK